MVDAALVNTQRRTVTSVDRLACAASDTAASAAWPAPLRHVRHVPEVDATRASTCCCARLHAAAEQPTPLLISPTRSDTHESSGGGVTPVRLPGARAQAPRASGHVYISSEPSRLERCGSSRRLVGGLRSRGYRCCLLSAFACVRAIGELIEARYAHRELTRACRCPCADEGRVRRALARSAASRGAA